MLTGVAEHESTNPLAVESIRNDFYVDDLCSGERTERGTIHLAKGVQWVLAQSGFELDKWRSNSLDLLKEFGQTKMDPMVFECLEQTSILGVKWQPNKDYYTFVVDKGESITYQKKNFEQNKSVV